MSDDSKPTQKITGYLEKRGKLKLMNSWKKYWFVLEGHLLLYYGSKEEYDALSPCKGSITLGPTCNVKPYASTPSKFQITTRSGSVITLRAETISEQNKWMQAIYSTVNENQKVDISPTKLCHFRYSTERLDVLMNNSEQKKRNPSPVPTDVIKASPPKTLERGDSNLLERLQRMGARSYCGNISPDNQRKNEAAIPKQLNLELNEKFSRNENAPKETAPSTPRKLQFSPKVPKINEEPRTKDEEVIMEDEDYCVCTLGKNEDRESVQVIKTPRSISFSDARDVFNQSPKLPRSPPKLKEKSGSDRSSNDNTQVSPREKLRKLVEKIHQSSKLTKENANEDIHTMLTDTNETPNNPAIQSENNEKAKKADMRKSSESIKTVNNNYRESNRLSENKEPQQSDQNNTTITPKSSEMLIPMEKKKEGSQISLLGAFYNNQNEDPDRPLGYQDFCENELYAKLNDKPPFRLEPNEEKKDILKSTEELYAEPELFEDNQTRKETPDFKFPPPPCEAYESNVDLASYSKYEDDGDSLYEEAESVVDEDFVWQNEIYASSVNPNEDQLYYEAEYQRGLEHNLGKKDQEAALKREEVEIDNDLYEEVDRDFEFQRSKIKDVDLENEIYAEPDFHQACQRSSSQAEFENDIYEEVNIQFQTNSGEHRADEDKQIYAQTSKHCFEHSQRDPNKNEEKQNMNNLYAKPNKRALRESNKPNNEMSSSIGEIQFQNDLYAKPDEISSRHHNLNDEDELQNSCSKREELQVDNDIYAVPDEVLCKDFSQTSDSYKDNEKPCHSSKEKQIENDIYAEPNLHSPRDSRHNHESIMQFENDLYAEPNIKPTRRLEKPIFSRQNSRTDRETKDKVEHNEPNPSKSPERNFFKTNLLDKLLNKKTKQGHFNDEENTLDLENELYARSNSNSSAQEASSLELYDEPNLQGMGRNRARKDSENDDMNVYEDPDQLRPQKIKEDDTKKKKKHSKAEEMKKQDSFIQRLLRPATKKHGDKSADITSKTVDETLALLTNMQVLLEKKKDVIKGMVTKSPKSNHRRLLSEPNVQLEGKDKCGATSLKKSISIGLDDEYSAVRDSLDDYNEVIYSEVEMVDRHSKEIKDFIEDLLERNKNSTQAQDKAASCTER